MESTFNIFYQDKPLVLFLVLQKVHSCLKFLRITARRVALSGFFVRGACTYKLYVQPIFCTTNLYVQRAICTCNCTCKSFFLMYTYVCMTHTHAHVYVYKRIVLQMANCSLVSFPFPFQNEHPPNLHSMPCFR